jgi:hypothetical protein
MTTDEVFASILQQNEVIITLLARLVWTPEKLAEVVTERKKNPDAYVSVYNALDGVKTGKQLGEIAGVTQQSISAVLQTWMDQGIVLNVGTDSLPKYRKLMRIPEKRKTKEKQQAQPETLNQEVQETQETNGANGQ